MMEKDLTILYNYFYENEKVLENGIVVECGTAEGHHNPSFTLENNFNWKFYGFEADYRFFPILEKNRPNGTNINMALSNKNDEAEFIISAWKGNSSLNHSKIHKEELETYPDKFEDNTFFKKIKIQTIEWNTFIKKYNINKVDFLILDVEGNELIVLETFNKNSVLPSVIQIEYGYSDFDNTYLNLDKKQNFSGIIKIYNRLISLGYNFDYVSYNNAFFSLNNFWNNKTKPEKWLGEDNQFIYRDICYYDKNIFLNLINKI